MKKPTQKLGYIISTMILSIALIVSLVAGGCNGQSSPTAAPSSQETKTIPTATAEAKTSVPVLKIGTTRQIKNSNPVSDYWFGVLHGFVAQESLVRINLDLLISPGLATKWESSNNATLWKFHIAQKAFWHDGKPVTTEDVKFSIEYRVSKDPQSAWMKDILDTVTIEGDAVVLKLKKPYATLLTEFDTYRILPKHIWEKVEDPLNYTGQDAVIGCGPYKLDKIDLAAGLISYNAVDNYFEGKPAVDRLEFKIYRNTDAMVMAFSKGDHDVIWDYSASIPYTSIPPLLNNPSIKLATPIDLGIPAALGFNLKQGPTSDVKFREALTYAIDYAKISELVFAGYGRVPTAGFVPDSFPQAHKSIRTLETNAQKAMEMLEAAGYKDIDGDKMRETPDGKKINLTILSRSDSDAINRASELVQSNLRAIGIASTLRVLDTATWVANKDKMEYDLVAFRTTPWGMLMHANYASGYFDSRRTGAGVLHNLDDPDFLALCDKILSTTDQKVIDEIYQKFQQTYAQTLPAIALTWAKVVYPYSDKFSGWEIDLIHGGAFNRYSLFALKAK